MHELPIITHVLDRVIEYAELCKAEKVISVDLSVGEFHDIVPNIAQKYYEFAAKGTIAEDSSLNITINPIICRCPSCKELFVFNLRHGNLTETCPVCGISDVRFLKVSGDEFVINRIQIV